MSNLIKPQLYPCQSALALRSFPPFALLWFNYILSCFPTSPPLLLLPPFFPIFILFCSSPLPILLLLLLTVMASGSTLTPPSARVQTNQSRVVLFHKDQKQLVSSHVSRFFLVCLCCPICLPAYTGTRVCVHASWIIFILLIGPAH